MKITICDPCKKLDNKSTETVRYMKVKGRPDLRLDICDNHGAEVKKMSMVDYVRYAYKCAGIVLTQNDEEIKQQFLRG